MMYQMSVSDIYIIGIIWFQSRCWLAPVYEKNMATSSKNSLIRHICNYLP